MFEKARKKFIKVAMLSIGAVFLVLLLGLNTINIVKEIKDSTKTAELILENNGNIPVPPTDTNKIDDVFLGEEARFDTRYFTVDYSTQGQYEYDLNNSVATFEKAKLYTESVLESNITKGYIGNYRFVVNKDSKTIVFLNCERSFHNMKRLALLSLMIYIIGLGITYLLIRLASNKVLKPVKDSYEKQKQFITNASHELKTPLTIISANNELIEINNGESEYSANISKQIDKMNHMVKDLTLLAKLGEVEKVVFGEFNLSNLTNEIVDNFKVNFQNNNIKINIDIEKDIKVNSDPKIISQALSVIFDNANKYAKEFFNLKLYSTKNHIKLIASNDCDLEDGNLMHLTDRFYRDNKSRVNTEGYGIGLSLLNEIVKLIHCELNIYSENKIFYIEIEY